MRLDLGTVKFPHLGGFAAAVLSDDRTWRIYGAHPSLEPMISDVLERIASLPHGPSDGFYGPVQLSKAATMLNGEVHNISLNYGDRGIVY
jgi:hypothetical protein